MKMAAVLSRVYRTAAVLAVALSGAMWLECSVAEEAGAGDGAVPEIVSELRAQVAAAEVPQGPFSCPIICADQHPSRAVIFDANGDWSDPKSVIWEWRPDLAEDLRPEHRAWFSHMDEVKPVLDRTHVLVTASGGGVALIRVSDKRVRFYAFAGGNPHSAALLPDGNVVSASSTGNFVTLFAAPKAWEGDDADPEKVPTTRYPFDDTHGMVWDDAQQILWVLGGVELAGFRYNFDRENPALERLCTYPLRDTLARGGHDLCPVPGSHLLFATGVGVEIFDTQTRTFYPLAEVSRVKSISLSPEGALIIQKPQQSWHSESILFMNAPRSVLATAPGSQFYKARWWY